MAAAPPAKKPQARRPPDAGVPMAYVLPLTMKYVVPAKEPIALFDSAIAVNVKPDDTLDSIAARTNTPAWVIGQVNKVTQDEPLRAGERILVPQIVFSAATAGAMKPALR